MLLMFLLVYVLQRSCGLLTCLVPSSIQSLSSSDTCHFADVINTAFLFIDVSTSETYIISPESHNNIIFRVFHWSNVYLHVFK